MGGFGGGSRTVSLLVVVLPDYIDFKMLWILLPASVLPAYCTSRLEFALERPPRYV